MTCSTTSGDLGTRRFYLQVETLGLEGSIYKCRRWDKKVLSTSGDHGTRRCYPQVETLGLEGSIYINPFERGAI